MIQASGEIRVDQSMFEDPDDILTQVQDVLALKSPCETCELANYCAENKLACKQFYKFVHDADESERPSDDYPGEYRYNLLFPGDREDD